MIGVFDSSEWLDMMGSTITIEPWVSQSVSGVPTFGAAVSYPCHIQMKNHYVISWEGREVMARGKVFLATTDLISVKDRVTMPAGTVPLQPPLMAVNRQDDETGSHHTVLEIG